MAVQFLAEAQTIAPELGVVHVKLYSFEELRRFRQAELKFEKFSGEFFEVDCFEMSTDWAALILETESTVKGAHNIADFKLWHFGSARVFSEKQVLLLEFYAYEKNRRSKGL